jgi:hypothetical protein
MKYILQKQSCGFGMELLRDLNADSECGELTNFTHNILNEENYSVPGIHSKHLIVCPIRELPKHRDVAQN